MKPRARDLSRRRIDRRAPGVRRVRQRSAPARKRRQRPDAVDAGVREDARALTAILSSRPRAPLLAATAPRCRWPPRGTAAAVARTEVARSEPPGDLLRRDIGGIDAVDHVGPSQIVERPIGRGGGAFCRVAFAPRVTNQRPADSVPGQPSGIHGPSRPIHRPVSFSMTENIPKPCACHEPIIVINARHVTARGITPPMNLAVGSSIIISAHGSRSARTAAARSGAVCRVEGLVSSRARVPKAARSEQRFAQWSSSNAR